ncbi:hypothetical protein NLX83_17570 [Allokutzneria sp. A3M-2-11 16]|uniref:hypothetical protein n=1 Tax=Allokutzneria sp. A3M-2-11 16 TaxID=2962043 RepID=UPI0020B78511|nr:hypothetical protein [Allokutzneria sp. A3M-2-11 16]MCP3801072.1 hypothetical protein [Allokutzneria sp. A3M-2-11 16]
MLQVADQLTEDPRLLGIGDAAVLLLHHRLAQQLRPGEVVQGDLAQPALVHCGRMLTGNSGDLVGDRQQRVEPLLPRDVEVGVELLGLQRVVPGLDLHERGPGPSAARDPDEAVRDELLLPQLERDLDEGLDPSGGRAEGLDHGPAELPHDGHDREQRRGGAALLLVGAADARGRDEPCGVPGLFCHVVTLFLREQSAFRSNGKIR